MTYEFQIGERVKIAGIIKQVAGINHPGRVVTTEDFSLTPHPERTARVRVKLDHWPRPLWFAKRDVNPL